MFTQVLAQAPTVQDTTGLQGAVQIAVGHDRACARMGDGTVRCSGDNSGLQLGDGTRNPSDAAVAVAGLSGAQEIGASQHRTCARLADGGVRCWRESFAFDAVLTVATSPRAAGGISDAVRLSSAEDVDCAGRRGGVVSCWGATGY